MYQFKLEPLLNHRRYEEEILQKELAKLRKRLANEQKKLRDIIKRKRKCLQELQQKQTTGNTVSEIILYLNYLGQLSNDIDDQQRRVLAAEKKFNLKRNDLIEVMKKRKTLDKLKDKGWQTYRHKMLKKERDFMDEVAANQFNREK